MPEYLAPGVFVEEINSGSKPIEGVGTNTTAFIGYAKSGEFNKPTFISNWTQFCQHFGQEEGPLLQALSEETRISPLELMAAKRTSRKTWMEFAQNVISAGVSKADGSVSVKNFSEFVRKYRIPQNGLPYMEDSYLAHAVRGYYDNGGSRAYVVRVARPQDIDLLHQANGTIKKNAPAPPAPATEKIAAQAAFGPVTVKALEAGPTGNDIKIDVEKVGEGDEFRVKISKGGEHEQYGFGKDKPLTEGSVMAAINNKSRFVAVEVRPAPDLKVEPITLNLSGGLEMAPPVFADAPPDSKALTNGSSGFGALSHLPEMSDLEELVPDDFVGDEAARTGASGLATLDNIDMICAPDLMAGVWQRRPLLGMDEKTTPPETLVLDDARRQQILDMQCGLVGYCERMGNRMAILDPIPGLSPQEIREQTLSTPYNCDHGQAALYYPWIKIADPMRRGQQMFVPPSGHIAGVYARVVSERGVHKAPANEGLIGAVALETQITKGEQEILNPEGINCIRAFPGMGIRVWGARTLATVGNPSWKYVNVRRLFNYLEKSMERGMQWVVFEPNDQDLWGRVQRNLSAFLYTEWKEGKLFGATPSEAFYVKCDAETNPQEMIDLGRLYVEVGINPVKPAEFVIVRIGQWSGGTSTNESDY